MYHRKIPYHITPHTLTCRNRISNAPLHSNPTTLTAPTNKPGTTSSLRRMKHPLSPRDNDNGTAQTRSLPLSSKHSRLPHTMMLNNLSHSNGNRSNPTRQHTTHRANFPHPSSCPTKLQRQICIRTGANSRRTQHDNHYWPTTLHSIKSLMSHYRSKRSFPPLFQLHSNQHQHAKTMVPFV